MCIVSPQGAAETQPHGGCVPMEPRASPSAGKLCRRVPALRSLHLVQTLPNGAVYPAKLLRLGAAWLRDEFRGAVKEVS